MVATPPNASGWGLCLVGLALGSLLGWQRGRMMRIDVDPATHRLTATQSPAAIMFIVVLIAVKSTMRGVDVASVGGLHLTPQSLTDVLIVFALGLLGVQRLEMYLRARRLLADARC
ncbi:MAG: hypothetical protein ABIO47_11095 [Sphingomicrobium sp.]